MKSYKFFLPLLAVLLLFGVSSVLAAPNYDRSVLDVSGAPKWVSHIPLLFDATAAPTLTVTNGATYAIRVTFKNATGTEISHFDINAGTISPATAIPVGTRSICVSTTVPGDADCIEAAGGSASIPTLSEWAMIIFSVLLLGMMTYYVVRRRRTAQSVAI